MSHLFLKSLLHCRSARMARWSLPRRSMSSFTSTAAATATTTTTTVHSSPTIMAEPATATIGNSQGVVETAAEKGFYLTDVIGSFLGTSDTLTSLTHTIQDAVIGAQTALGLSYPVILLSAAFAVRLCVSPLMLVTCRFQEKALEHSPQVMAKAAFIQERRAAGASTEELGQLYKEAAEYQMKNGVNPYGLIGSVLLQVSLTGPFFAAISQLHERVDLSEAGVSLFFMQNLSVSSFPLVLLTALPFMTAMENSLKTNQRLTAAVINQTRSISFVVFGFSALTSYLMPATVQLFILGAMMFQVAFTRALLNPRFRTLARLKPLKPLPPDYTTFTQWIRQFPHNVIGNAGGNTNKPVNYYY